MQNISRRSALKSIGAGAAAIGASKGFAVLGTVGSIALMESACGPNMQLQFAIARQILGAVSQTLDQLHLPGPVALATKAIKIVDDMAAAYKAGKFKDALTFLNEIAMPGGLFDQILNDVNVQNNPTIKGFMLALNGALRVIAIILESQKNQVGVSDAIAAAPNAPEVQTVRKLADVATLDKALNALRF